MGEDRYVLLDVYEGYCLIGSYNFTAEVKAAATKWKKESDGECDLVLLEYDHTVLMGVGAPAKHFYRRVTGPERANDKTLTDKHWSECRQIALYDDELRKARALLKRFVELGEPHALTLYELQTLLTEYIGLREEAVKLLGGSCHDK
ncbi:MAG: hypothetical protein IJ737_08115 [Ruminococcus sp.]|nr:hypothetical protein [Ruminococcus sp.]